MAGGLAAPAGHFTHWDSQPAPHCGLVQQGVVVKVKNTFLELHSDAQVGQSVEQLENHLEVGFRRQVSEPISPSNRRRRMESFEASCEDDTMFGRIASKEDSGSSTDTYCSSGLGEVHAFFNGSDVSRQASDETPPNPPTPPALPHTLGAAAATLGFLCGDWSTNVGKETFEANHQNQSCARPVAPETLRDTPVVPNVAERSPSKRADNRAWVAGTTTVMIRNLPNKYTQETLLQALKESGFHPIVHFDFFYLPMDRGNGANLGYGFVNFTDETLAHSFAQMFQSRQMKRFNSRKTIDVVPALIQGYEANHAHYATTRVVRADDHQCRPLFMKEQASAAAALAATPAAAAAPSPQLALKKLALLGCVASLGNGGGNRRRGGGGVSAVHAARNDTEADGGRRRRRGRTGRKDHEKARETARDTAVARPGPPRLPPLTKERFAQPKEEDRVCLVDESTTRATSSESVGAAVRVDTPERSPLSGTTSPSMQVSGYWMPVGQMSHGLLNYCRCPTCQTPLQQDCLYCPYCASVAMSMRTELHRQPMAR